MSGVARVFLPAMAVRRRGRPRHTYGICSAGVFAGISIFLLTACGYHTAGHATAIPQDVRTIAIPPFVNQTHTYKIEQMLTAAVVREMVTRTNYHVINQAGEDADATLRGTVLSTYTTPLTYDSTTGRAASVLVVISMSVSLQDKQGKALYQNPAYLFREQYEVSRDPNSFFEEDTPALQRLSRDFAQTLVSNILEGF
ncbi:MAG TPA: LptE family protein [Terriglobales bacterium]|nr:LptE family protein [Terriglobales bacterium]